MFARAGILPVSGGTFIAKEVPFRLSAMVTGSNTRGRNESTDSKMNKYSKSDANRRQFLRRVGAGATIATTAGCLSQGSGDDSVLRIGQTVGLSGSLAPMDEGMRNGTELAIDQAKEDGLTVDGQEVEIEHIVEDNESDPNQARSQVEQFISQDNCQIILGGTGSSFSLAIKPVTEQNEIPFVNTGGSATEIYEGADYLVGCLPTLEPYGRGMLQLLSTQEDPPSKVGLLAENSVVGQNGSDFILEFAEQNDFPFEVEQVDTYERGTSDMSSSMNKAQNSGVDALFNVGHFTGDVNTVRQPAQMDYSLKAKWVYVSITLDFFLDEIGDLANGVTGFSAYHPDLDTPGNDDFVEAYGDAYDLTPGYHDGLGYAGGLIALEAVQQAGSLDTEEINQAMHEMAVPTPAGTLSFGPNGEPQGVKKITVQVQDGEREVVWPIEDRTTEEFIYPLD